LFRRLLLQIGGANIENPPLSSSLSEERTPQLAPPLRRRAIPDARSPHHGTLVSATEQA
jgi:hypothetical protein